MIIEQRTYTLKVGKVPEYLRLYESEGLAIQKPILGRMVGFFSSDIGTLQQIVHMWAYLDFSDRQERRSELDQDPRWQAYLPKAQALQISQCNKILTPAPFSPWSTDEEQLS